MNLKMSGKKAGKVWEAFWIAERALREKTWRGKVRKEIRVGVNEMLQRRCWTAQSGSLTAQLTAGY